MDLKTEDEVINLEKVIGQLQGLHAEISLLTKKSANDGLNMFKLKSQQTMASTCSSSR